VQGDPSFRAGNGEDFERLYKESYPRVLKTMVAMVGDTTAAQDCAQEAFGRAHKAWHRWRPASSPEAWVQQIAVRVAVSRRRHDRLRHLGGSLRRLPWKGHAPDHDGSNAPGDTLIAALRSLPPRQAAAVVLRYHHGYSNQEIATALGAPESTVADQLTKARAALSVALENQSSSSATLMLPGAHSR